MFRLSVYLYEFLLAIKSYNLWTAYQQMADYDVGWIN